MHEPEVCVVAASAGDVCARSGPWYQASLPEMLTRVLERYSRTALDDRPDDLAGEALAIAGAGLDLAAVLMCAIVCAAACNECGPAVAYGPWALSVAAGLVARDRHDSARPEVTAAPPSSGVDSNAFVDWLRSDYADMPTLLMPEEPDLSLLREIEGALPGLEVRTHRLDDRTSVMSLAQHGGAVTPAPDAPEPLFDVPPIQRRGASVRLVVSGLCRAVAAAVASEVDMDGYSAPIPPEAPTAEQAVLSALMGSAWPRLLPDLATASLPMPQRLEGVEELASHWLSGLSAVALPSAAHAVRSQAALVWQLAVITGRNPTAGYRGLLLGAGEDRLAQCMRAATESGVPLDVAEDADECAAWRLDQDGDRFVLRCPPCSAPDATGSAPCQADREAARTVAIQDERYLLAASPAGPGAGMVVLGAGDRGTPPDRSAAEHATESEVSTVAVETGGWRMAVSRRLLDESPPFVVEVQVELSGDRDADLQRIASVHALLDKHQGPVKARLVLVRSSFRRVVERAPARGVSYSAALEQEARQIVGPDHLTLRLDVPVGSS